MSGDFANLLADLKEDEVIKLTKQRLDSGEDPMKILEDSRKGMELVGKRFADGEYFLPELVFSGELLKQVTEIVKPHITETTSDAKRRGKVVLGTVAGDIHDIGLNIVGVTGRGVQKGIVHAGRAGQAYSVDMLPKVKLEIVVSDKDADRILSAIAAAACSIRSIT